jgi:N utilization substance protein A
MDIYQVLTQMANERELPLDELKAELEQALESAYKKFVGHPGDVRISIEPQSGWSIFVEKEVVTTVENPAYQIPLEVARKRKQEIEVGDTVPVKIDPNRFGRIAANTFKQVLNQKLREAEQRHTEEVLNEQTGKVVTGIVQRGDPRGDGRAISVLVGKVECELPREEQVYSEARDRYTPNSTIRVYILPRRDKDREMRRQRVIVSRSHPELVRGLFEIEVPEIQQEIVVIKGVAREKGQRSKIAVISTDPSIDPVGACVGVRGARVLAISEELHGEKLDIVPFSEDPNEFISNALSPSKVLKITFSEVDQGDEEKAKVATVVVPDAHEAKAIGKDGVNAKLAGKLTGYMIAIKSESKVAEEAAGT